MVVHDDRMESVIDRRRRIHNFDDACKAVVVTDDIDRVRSQTMWDQFNERGMAMVEIALQWRIPAEEVEQILRDERERLRVEHQRDNKE